LALEVKLWKLGMGKEKIKDNDQNNSSFGTGGGRKYSVNEHQVSL
jgi:hypothetical protein